MRTRKLTQKETRERILKAMGEGLFTGGLGDPPEARRLAETIFSKPAQYTAEAAISPILAHLFYTSLGRRLKNLKRRRLTEQELQPILKDIKDTTETLTPKIRKGLDEMKKRLVQHGGPGRRTILDPKQQHEAIQFVGVHLIQGKRLPEAFKQVAETFTVQGKKVSAQTIKRIWQKRALLSA